MTGTKRKTAAGRILPTGAQWEQTPCRSTTITLTALCLSKKVWMQWDDGAESDGRSAEGEPIEPLTVETAASLNTRKYNTLGDLLL